MQVATNADFEEACATKLGVCVIFALDPRAEEHSAHLATAQQVAAARQSTALLYLQVLPPPMPVLCL